MHVKNRIGGCVDAYCWSGHCLLHFTLLWLLVVNENVAQIGGFTANNQQRSTAELAKPLESSLHALSDTHRLAKRMDLETCLVQFDVHNNTIIRTGESQEIGGKYLQSLDLSTIEECQRLCCETESCDVYVFEEKNGGYCYLFECGPPENFHCKFTRHANYTSAVLTPVNHFVEITTPKPTPPQLPLQATHLGSSNLSQQEWELTSLKVKPESHKKLVDIGTLGTNVVSNAAIGNSNNIQQQSGIDLPQKAIANSSVSHCGRFQFTCHSGECIAVYNACDGIPQCEDGSDEGPECSGAQSSNTKSTNAEVINVNGNDLVDATVPKPQYHVPLVVQQTPQQSPHQIPQQQAQAQAQTSIVNNREDASAWASRKVVAELQQTGGISEVDMNSHIFTHKNGIQISPHGGMNVIGGPTNSGSNTGVIDLNSGLANYPNSNANLNPLYNANLQRSGIYLPQSVTGQQNNDVYVVPQQQILSQQGHMYGSPNLNWPQQQSQQQQQTQQYSPIVSQNGAMIQQNLPYMINTAQQTMPHFVEHQQSEPSQAKAILHQASVPNGGSIIQQKPPMATIQQSNDVPSLGAGQGSAVGDERKGSSSSKKVLSAADNPSAGEENESYNDYEESTEPPKKKLRKNKKVKSKTLASNIVPKELPNITNQDLGDDPVQQSIAYRKQQQQQQQQSIRSQPQSPLPVHEQYKIIHENLALEFRDHDGQSDRPGGAVLSLTLGVLITAALAILIGCRMRTVGRRVRRMGGKTPYSHEADFLVNGMYL